MIKEGYPNGEIQAIPVAIATLEEAHRPWQMGDPIVEPQGIYQLPNGRLVISRECS